MSMRQFRRALRASVGQPVAYQILDGHGAAIAPLLEGAIRGDRVRDADLLSALATDDCDASQIEAMAERLAAPLVIPAGKGGKATALLSVRGIALYDLEFQPFCFSTLRLAQTMTALMNDPEIGTVILDIDSPGGVVTGTPEAADAVFAAREAKRVVALVNPLCASAAYWIAAQASEIVAVPSADVGSIGVFMLHVDCSAAMEGAGIKPTFVFAGDHKVEGNMFEPLSEETKAYLKGEVVKVYRDFLKAVARGRGVPVSKIEADFGQGRALMARDALKAGMVDRVATINAAMARWGISAATLEGRRRGEEFAPEPQAEDDAPETESVVGEEGPEIFRPTEPADAHAADDTSPGKLSPEAQTRLVEALVEIQTEAPPAAEPDETNTRAAAVARRRRRLALLERM